MLVGDACKAAHGTGTDSSAAVVAEHAQLHELDAPAAHDGQQPPAERAVALDGQIDGVGELGPHAHALLDVLHRCQRVPRSRVDGERRDLVCIHLLEEPEEGGAVAVGDRSVPQLIRGYHERRPARRRDDERRECADAAMKSWASGRSGFSVAQSR
jgi:hypothetical protein